jgi:hypothetical protein
MPQLEISLQKRTTAAGERVAHLTVRERHGKSNRVLIVNRAMPASHSVPEIAFDAMRTAIKNIGKAMDEFEDLPPYVKTR